VPDTAVFTESGHKPGETVIFTGKIKNVGSTYVEQWNYLKGLPPKERINICNIQMSLTSSDFCSEKMLQGFKEHNEDATTLLDSYIAL